MLTQSMKKIEAYILDTDCDLVLSVLGQKGWIELENDISHSNQDKKECSIDMYKTKLASIMNMLLIPHEQYSMQELTLPQSKDFTYVDSLYTNVQVLCSDKDNYIKEIDKLSSLQKEAEALKLLDIHADELESLSFIVCRIGTLSRDGFTKVKSILKDRVVIIQIAESNTVIALASRKGRFALDTELQNASFVPINAKTIPLNFDKESLNVIALGLRQSKDNLEKTIKEIDNTIKTNKDEIIRLKSMFDMTSEIEKIRSSLQVSDRTYRLSGWIPSIYVSETVASLKKITNNRIAIMSYDPEELDDVKTGKEKVPVVLKHGKILKSFDTLVASYGIPIYGSIDPTIFVACSFVILFSIMFGDVGQGFILLLVGLLLGYTQNKALVKWKKYSPIFLLIGIGSMVMGFLDGSFFSNEEILIGITNTLSSALLGEKKDRFIEIMPKHGVEKLFIFFGYTIALGVILNCVGLIINIYNKFAQKKYKDALFSKIGLAGLIFFLYGLSFAIRPLLGISFNIFEPLFLLIPLSMIILSDVIENIIHKKKLLKDGIFSFIIHSFVEILESVSFYFTGTISFLRVGAFAFSHAVLSFIVFTIASLMKDGVPFGFFFQVLVFIIGNVIIIVLEGMIVAIQVVRLEYYEFFSKFFTESGRPFLPFMFTCVKEKIK